MTKKKYKTWLTTILAVFGVLFLGAGSWALYSVVNQGASDLLSMVGVSNFYAQAGIVVGIVFAGLILTGTGVLRAIVAIAK